MICWVPVLLKVSGWSAVDERRTHLGALLNYIWAYAVVLVPLEVFRIGRDVYQDWVRSAALFGEDGVFSERLVMLLLIVHHAVVLIVTRSMPGSGPRTLSTTVLGLSCLYGLIITLLQMAAELRALVEALMHGESSACISIPLGATCNYHQFSLLLGLIDVALSLLATIVAVLIAAYAAIERSLDGEDDGGFLSPDLLLIHEAGNALAQGMWCRGCSCGVPPRRCSPAWFSCNALLLMAHSLLLVPLLCFYLVVGLVGITVRVVWLCAISVIGLPFMYCMYCVWPLIFRSSDEGLAGRRRARRGVVNAAIIHGNDNRAARLLPTEHREESTPNPPPFLPFEDQEDSTDGAGARQRAPLAGSPSALFGDGNPLEEGQPSTYLRPLLDHLQPSHGLAAIQAGEPLPQIAEHGVLNVSIPEFGELDLRPIDPPPPDPASAQSPAMASMHIGQGPAGVSAVSLAAATANWAESRVLGGGGFGKVYLAERLTIAGFSSPTTCAVKRLDEGANLQGIRELNNELVVLGSCSHPHILPIYGFCHDVGCHCLILPLARGGSLHDRIFAFSEIRDLRNESRTALCRIHTTPQRLGWRDLLGVLRDVASALVYLHSHSPDGSKQPVLHRDVKPQNILLDEHGRPLLADVGLAKAATELSQGQSAVLTTQLVGTPGYIDPLYMNGNGRISTLTDGFAFGVTMLVALVAQPAVVPGGTALTEACEDLLESPASSNVDGWADPGALWPAEFAKKVAELISGLVCRQKRHRRRLTEVHSRLVGLVDAAEALYGVASGESEQDSAPSTTTSSREAEGGLFGGFSRVTALHTEPRECVVCLSEPRATRFAPCGHATCCMDCAHSLLHSRQPCPTCRAPVHTIAECGSHIGTQDTFLRPVAGVEEPPARFPRTPGPGGQQRTPRRSLFEDDSDEEAGGGLFGGFRPGTAPHAEH